MCEVTRAIHNPNQLLVEGFASLTFIGVNIRMLELKHPPLIGLHIRNVLLTAFGFVDPLLPLLREPVFPGAVPFGLMLPPRFTIASNKMCPMMYPDISAPCNHRTTAGGADARTLGLGLLALSINKRKLHIQTPATTAS